MVQIIRTVFYFIILLSISLIKLITYSDVSLVFDVSLKIYHEILAIRTIALRWWLFINISFNKIFILSIVTTVFDFNGLIIYKKLLKYVNQCTIFLQIFLKTKIVNKKQILTSELNNSLNLVDLSINFYNIIKQTLDGAPVHMFISMHSFVEFCKI